MEIEKSIQNRIEERKVNILKGIVNKDDVRIKDSTSNQLLEKARNVGETKVGKDGITRVWTKLPNGKFDWRRQPKKESDSKFVETKESTKRNIASENAAKKYIELYREQGKLDEFFEAEHGDLYDQRLDAPSWKIKEMRKRYEKLPELMEKLELKIRKKEYEEIVEPETLYEWSDFIMYNREHPDYNND
jgi:hypothetical protein